MGWTAGAYVVVPDFWRKGEDDISRIDENHPAMTEFTQAAKRIQDKFEYGDETLNVGLLCLRSTGQALFEAVGHRMKWSGLWRPEDVRRHSKAANWSLLSTEFLPGHRECAKTFLTICAKHDLAISFG